MLLLDFTLIPKLLTLSSLLISYILTSLEAVSSSLRQGIGNVLALTNLEVAFILSALIVLMDLLSSLPRLLTISRNMPILMTIPTRVWAVRGNMSLLVAVEARAVRAISCLRPLLLS